MAALDLLDYRDEVARRTGREVLHALGETKPLVLARRSAKARALIGSLAGGLFNGKSGGKERPRVEGDPRTDTRAAAAHIVAVLWASASQGLTVKELRAAVGMSRERFEDAYAFLGNNPPLGLAIVAYRQPIARSGVEHIRGSASDSAIPTLLERGLIAQNPHHLLVTTRTFLEHAGVGDLSDLPHLGLDEQVEIP